MPTSRWATAVGRRRLVCGVNKGKLLSTFSQERRHSPVYSFSDMLNILDFGARGNGRTDDTESIQNAIDECAIRGGGRIIVPSGTASVAGPLLLRNGVDLHLEQGSMLCALLEPERYRCASIPDPGNGRFGAWIRADEANEISISGFGTIDGRGVGFMEDEEETHFIYRHEGRADGRPQLLQLRGCSRISITGVTFRDSARWALHFGGCRDISIHDIRVLNSLKIPNADAIDIDGCRNVRISNCHIESADDSICLKSRREFADYGPTENILVTNCTLVSTSCAFKIGSENVKGIRNVVASNLVITRSNRGFGIRNRDQGIVENVKISNTFIETRRFAEVWWGKSEPISITSLPRGATTGRIGTSEYTPPVGTIRRIQFSDVSCSGENGILVYGSAASRPQEISFDRVDVELVNVTEFEGGMYDLRPCEGDGIRREPATGFRIHHADGIRFRECRARTNSGKHPLAPAPIVTFDTGEGDSGWVGI